jgi:hypothetical protein
MVASGSRERAKRPRRSSHRNGKSPSDQFRAGCHSGDQSRKPRVLGTSTLSPVGQEEFEARGSSVEVMTPEIPRLQFARIRALVKHGMTVSQVAEVYKVAVGEIERLLRKAGGDGCLEEAAQKSAVRRFAEPA